MPEGETLFSGTSSENLYSHGCLISEFLEEFLLREAEPSGRPVGETGAVHRYDLVGHAPGVADGVFDEAGGKVRATTYNQDLWPFLKITTDDLPGRILGPALGEACSLGVTFETPNGVSPFLSPDHDILVVSRTAGKEPFDSLDHGAPLLSPPQGRRGSGEGSALPGHNLRLCFIVFVELIMVS
jgi:hypothetical protein